MQVGNINTMPSLIAKTTKPLPRETTSEYDKALLLLERCLPETPSRLWINSEGIVGLFKKGGLDFSKTFISRALKSNKNNSRRWAMNKFLTKWHYCFPGECATTFASPKDQRDFLKAATTEDEKERICPSIPEGYFLDFKLKHLDKFRCQISATASTDSPPSASSSPTAPKNPTKENARQTPGEGEPCTQ